jgi:hypothetical protein
MTYGSIHVAMSTFGSIAKTLVWNALFYPTGSIIMKHKIGMMIVMVPTLTEVTVSITHMRILLSRHPTMQKKPSNNEGWPSTDTSKQWMSPRSRTKIEGFFFFVF